MLGKHDIQLFRLMDNIFVSIHLNSNRPQNITSLIKNIEQTASNPSQIEIIINIDDGDNESENTINNLKETSLVKILYIKTNIIKSFKDIWKPYNELLKLTNKDAEFISLFSDEFRFKTKGWDDILKKYIAYYEDNIFYLRLSNYRFRNYSDFWECIFAPDSLAFYTKKWLDTIGMWCPCTGPDSWQSLVSFYLIKSRKFDHIQYCRSITENFIEINGEGAGVGLSRLKARQRNIDNVDLWFETVSHKMQEKAKYAAAKLQAEIIMHKSNFLNKISHNFTTNRKPPTITNIEPKNLSYQNNKEKKQLEFLYNKEIIYKINYKINKFTLTLKNNLRKINYPYYAGGGEESFRTNLIDLLYTYSRIRKYGDFGYKKLINLKTPQFIKTYRLNKIWSIIKNLLKVLQLFLLFSLKLTYSTKYYRYFKRKLTKYAKKYQ